MYCTIARTRWPSATSASVRWEPMNPSAPVTATSGRSVMRVSFLGEGVVVPCGDGGAAVALFRGGAGRSRKEKVSGAW
ncbi:hypothetical protein GCM10010218_45670 [Streptomyces mashuensis]|uniref:Uncharacterized protein n=1 Tax=Streptomyces mashuensis TaxID=33904 RepID=A0A919EEQ2_9ACTN|nr:hypothetical protein GCM10010218_45670 [Streptomyces mashuensis]